MEVKNNCYVKLWDYANKEILTYRIIEQSMKTHYIGGDVHVGHYYMKSEQVLSLGGDGFDTISLNSRLGKAIEGRNLGDTVSYTRDDGIKEKFRIIGISCDGTDWEEVQIQTTDEPDEVLDSDNDDKENRAYESKRLRLVNYSDEAWKVHCSQVNRLGKELRSLRMRISKKESVPPYSVFQDKSLIDLCENLPVTRSQLLTVHGFREARINRYGDQIIEVIKKYIDSIDLSKVDEPKEEEQAVLKNENRPYMIKKCVSCEYMTADPRFKFCPICGKPLDEKED